MVFCLSRNALEIIVILLLQESNGSALVKIINLYKHTVLHMYK